MKNHDKRDTPGVHIPPPIIVALFLGLGIWLDRLLHTGFGELADSLKTIGLITIALAAILGLWCALLYHQTKTNILPHTADNALMDHGPFSFSRNPIYVAMVAVFIGVCLYMNAPLALVMLVPIIFALRFYVIAKEEAYLERRFGEKYLEYKSRVRRWI